MTMRDVNVRDFMRAGGMACTTGRTAAREQTRRCQLSWALLPLVGRAIKRAANRRSRCRTHRDTRARRMCEDATQPAAVQGCDRDRIKSIKRIVASSVYWQTPDRPDVCRYPMSYAQQLISMRAKIARMTLP